MEFAFSEGATIGIAVAVYVTAFPFHHVVLEVAFIRECALHQLAMAMSLSILLELLFIFLHL